MRSNEFKRAAALMAPAKELKTRIRLLPRKTRTALSVHAVLGLSRASAKLLVAVRPFILGTQLNDDIREDGRVALGEYFQHLVQLARVLKVKVPSTTKKVVLKGETLTEALLSLNEKSADLLDLPLDILNGDHLDEKHDFQADLVETLQGMVEELLSKSYAVCYSVLGALPAEAMAEHYERLESDKGVEFFAKPKAAE